MENGFTTEIVIYAGILVGSLAILGVVWVWARKQVFGLGGGVLSFFGTVLIGLSVFSRAQITIGDTTIVLETLQQQVETLEQDKIQLAEEVGKLSRNADLQRSQFIAIGQSLQQQAEPQMRLQLNSVMQPLEGAEPIDYEALEKLQEPGRVIRQN